MYTTTQTWTNNPKKTQKADPASRWIKLFSACRSAAGVWVKWYQWILVLLFAAFAHVKLIPEKQRLVNDIPNLNV